MNHDRTTDPGGDRPRTRRTHDFTHVDGGAAGELVAMMDATDAWPAVDAARCWALGLAGAVSGALVLDAGCGPGTFGLTAADAGAMAVDVDRSLVMLGEVRRRRPQARVAIADISALPFADRVAELVHAERVLQWVIDPHTALTEMRRVTAAGGWTVVTDTDWSTLVVDHPDPAATRRLTDAAVRWVPNARLAPDLAGVLETLGTTELRLRTDEVRIDQWDPDHPTQRDGPPGLPLHSIAAGGAKRVSGGLERDLAELADTARRGAFSASLMLVTVAARA